MQDDNARDIHERSIDKRTALQKVSDEFKAAVEDEKRVKNRRLNAFTAIEKVIADEAVGIKARYKEAYGEWPEPGPVWNAFLHASLLAAGLPAWYELETDCMEPQ